MKYNKRIFTVRMFIKSPINKAQNYITYFVLYPH